MLKKGLLDLMGTQSQASYADSWQAQLGQSTCACMYLEMNGSISNNTHGTGVAYVIYDSHCVRKC